MEIIKPIALKEAKILSNEEMKHLFGDSGNSIVSFCSIECDGDLTISLINCSGTCTVNPSSSVTCSGTTKVFTKNCDGSSSLVTR